MIIALLFGVMLGSFVNALVWRLALGDPDIKSSEIHKPKKKLSAKQLSISKGRSVCVHCGHQLEFKDLLPVVSWLSLGGKCRYCKKNISAQYPLVELLTGILFALSYQYWPTSIELGASGLIFALWLAMVVGLVAIAIYDIRWMLIPDKILFPLIGFAVLSVIVQALLVDKDASSVRDSSLGLILIGGFFFMLHYVSKGRWIGGGDVKFSFLMSIYLGISKIAVGLVVGFYSAAFVVFPLVLFKKLSRKQQVPFGPFLILGLVIATLFSRELIDFYNDLFLF